LGAEAARALLMDLLAAACGGVELARLTACAAAAGIEAPRGRSSRAVLIAAQQLEREGVLTIAGSFTLEPGLAERRRRQLIREGRFEPLAALVAAELPLPTRRAGWRRITATTLRRELRRALVAGDGARLAALQETWAQHQERIGPPPSLVAWVDGPLELELLRGLDVDVSGPLLDALSRTRALAARPVEPLLPLLSERWDAHPDQPALRCALGREAMVAGEPALAARALDGLDGMEGLALRGMLALILGDPQGSVRCYARALAQRRKRDGRGVDRLEGPEGVLAPLAYRLHPSASRRAQGARLSAPPLEPDHPLAVLNRGLERWRDQQPQDSRALEGARDRADAAGQRWLAAELDALFTLDPRRSAPGVRALMSLGDPDDGQPSADPRLVLRLRPAGAGLLAELRGPRGLDADGDASDELLSAVPALARAPLRGRYRVLDGAEEALELLEALAPLGERVRVEWPEGEPLRLRAVLGPEALQLRVRGRGDWFDTDGGLRVDRARVVALGELLALARRGRRFLTLDDGRVLALTQALVDQLALIDRIAQPDGAGGQRVHRLAAGALAPALDAAGSAELDESWELQLRALEAVDAPEPSVPGGLHATLRPYQQRGFAWLVRLAELGAGACLADDMGLGKTVQVLALLLHRAWLGPALVVAPTSVCSGWVDQATRFASGLRVRRFGPGDRAAMLASIAPGELVVCSYGLLQADRELLASLRWSTVVLDEAQAIKNPDTQRHRAACALQAEQRVITTGTPIENHLGELWALLRFLQPGLLGSREAFHTRFAEPIAAGLSAPLQQLRQLVLPFVLRRTKGEVLQELPPRTEQRIEVELLPDEAALYEAQRERAEGFLDSLEDPQSVQILAQLTRLRMACCHPSLVLEGAAMPSAKLAAFGELVEQLRAGGHRALVFSQFVRHLAILRGWLDERGVPYQYLDGSTPASQRDRAVRAFQGGEGDLFLISLRAGGFGLNLTAAETVIHMDPWWNPAVEDQASDRAHRIGQRRPVTVYRIIAKGTVEEKILALHASKRELAEQLLEGSDAAGRLSVGELMALIRGA